MRCPMALRPFFAATLAVAALTALPLRAAEPASTRELDPFHLPRTIERDRPQLGAELVAEAQEWRHMRALMGPGDLRRLDAAYVRFNLMSQFTTDPERDPFYDRTRETVRSGYMKMYREILERQYEIDDLLDSVRTARAARRMDDGRGGGEAGVEGSPWHLKVSPRVAVGSNGYLGVRLALPNTGIARLDHLQLSMRHGVFEPEWAVGLRYAHGPRFLQLERVVGDETTGERYTLTVATRF
jgi:hypothetical protein